MPRPPRGQEDVDRALCRMANATTIEQLRQAQAVLFPLRYGLSLEQTAEAIGVSRGWACRLRNQFIAGKVVGDKGKAVRGGRRRENFSHECEAALLKPFLESASHGGILVVSTLSSKPRWGARWRCRRCTSCCIGITGANLPPIKDPPKAILGLRMTEKNSTKRSSKSAKAGPKAPPSA